MTLSSHFLSRDFTQPDTQLLKRNKLQVELKKIHIQLNLKGGVSITKTNEGADSCK